MKRRALAIVLLLAPALVRAQVSPAEVTPGEAVPAGGGSAEATVGWGYYELLHVGLAAKVVGRSTVGILVGSNLGTNGRTNWSAGFSYAHAVGPPVWDVQLGWKVTALYWTQSDPDYDWKLLSLPFGVTAVQPLTPELSVALDAGVTFTTTLASDRKQDVTFSNPHRWNGSVCVELRYRFRSW